MNHFTEALGLPRYTLYMQDYGGPVGFRMALAHPDRIEALIVQNGVYVIDAGHFALDTAADEIAALVRGFLGASR
jgi:hypothetical protein